MQIQQAFGLNLYQNEPQCIDVIKILNYLVSKQLSHQRTDPALLPYRRHRHNQKQIGFVLNI